LIAVKPEELKTETSTNKRRPGLVISGLSNWAALGVNTIISLLLIPYVIGCLGKRDYGTWALAGSFVGYYGLLHLGVGSAIMRYMPFYVGRNDQKAASEIVSTGLAMFFGVGLVIFSLSMLIAEPIARFYEGGPKLATLVRLTGLAAAVECPTLIFGAGLRAQERWVSANSVQIVTGVMQALGIAGCIYLGYGLVEMGYVTLATTVFSLILMTVIFIKLSPAIHLRVSMVTLSRLRELFLFGLSITIATLAYSLSLQSHRLIIGKLVSLEAVAVYTVAAVFVERVRRIVWAPLQVSWTRFALLDGQNNHQEVSRLFYRTTRFTGILSSGLILLVLMAGPSFIRLWVGEGFEAAYRVLIILAIGCLIESSLYVNSSLLSATGHQVAYAILSGLEGILGITLSILLGISMGMVGVAIGFTVAVAVIRGLVCPWYVCHILQMSVPRYYFGCLLRPWVIMGFLAILAHSIRITGLMNDWASWIISVIAIGGLYTLCAFVIAMNNEERKKVLSIIRQLTARIPIPAGIKRQN
jgi:O-antigen/teichoic acid export membrane protein